MFVCQYKLPEHLSGGISFRNKILKTGTFAARLHEIDSRPDNACEQPSLRSQERIIASRRSHNFASWIKTRSSARCIWGTNTFRSNTACITLVECPHDQVCSNLRLS